MKILLIEDNESDIMVIERALINGIALEIANDGQQAMQYLRAGERPDIILLDLGLPIVDGQDILQYVRSNRAIRRVPVIVLTSSKAEADIRAAYDGGANAYFVKPVTFVDFVKTIKLIKEFWKQTRRPS
jgi:CheY-like chemotaxis protein